MTGRDQRGCGCSSIADDLYVVGGGKVSRRRGVTAVGRWVVVGVRVAAGRGEGGGSCCRFVGGGGQR